MYIEGQIEAEGISVDGTITLIMSANGGWEELAGFFLGAADFLGEDIAGID